ncbi:glycosyltransferase family 2 protein [Flavobacterium hungaricum]|uniref:Glycosyltransferase n=1 Tax=Flavobacterium hungaricum TaxID=2082725 RepID=A0ABR9TQW2_9FLAO|nr:glycosyltransferase family 2 protein [Flavobacterium hungaricum]MBE8727760.1 glycosyltransferase [Flavobacterium hungaricum]
MEKISIVTVVYNGMRYLEKTILSVINQTYSNIEYIIVDGGSTDGTLDIIEKYKSKIDIAISEPDKGLSDAMNKGARLATGDWILYLHADDTFTDNQSVEKLIKASILNSATSWVTGYLRFQNSSDEIFRKDSYHNISWNGMIIRNVIRHQSTMVRLKNFMDIQFNQKYKYAMDYDFFLRLWKKYGDPIVINEYIADFRLDGNNLSSNYYASIKDEMRVRIDFRKNNKDYHKLPFDSFIYFLRYCKIYFIHNRKKNVE